ncbi:hypothetical protein NADFUDRAFT_49151 [Nadsonia fulvescens var. elongata DSM 6958]|uniref:Protein-tyrosine phosphatase n=1 Tax=Nadsonia fulvescens var. elongata DSM 6958 TaxID=857566 RepID=A0A1E3PSV9_9ASCO|nr:hypothetical protein NADFUDRAFT_49151 [Nadsonia fulvescens var. elongata DSM 6958]
MLAPPDNFGVVEESLYRCSSLSPLSFPFLDTLSLKTILFLNPEKPNKPIRSYAQDSDIKLNHLGLRPWFKHARAADWMVFNTELLQDGISAILDIRNQPLLIVDSTNAFVGVLRMVLHWNYSSIVAEYRTFSGGKSHYGTEIFLELLKVKREYAFMADDYKEEGESRVSNLENEGVTAIEPTTIVSGTTTPAATPTTPLSTRVSASAMSTLNRSTTPSPLPRSRKNNSTLVLKLSSKKYLPEWFVFQHDLWLEEELELNSTLVCNEQH